MIDELKYFKIAKFLNDKHHEILIEKKLHFRGNKNSISLISLSKETAEKGIPNIKEIEKAESILKSPIKLEKPKRDTPEKVLQAWLIYTSMLHGGKLAFKDLTFITSELVFENKALYGLSKSKRDIRNDILALDENNNLCIVELKSARDNEVKKQTVEFEKVIQNEKDFFNQLVKLYTNKSWNGSIRKISVWPNKNGKLRLQKYLDVEEVNYSETDNGFLFH